MNLLNCQKIVLGFSAKKDGSMKNDSKGQNVNRFQFIQKQFLGERNIIVAKLADTNRVMAFDDDVIDLSKMDNCDALITNNPKQLLIITMADCLPIFFYDEIRQVVALAHAGWRGVLSNIAKEVVDVFKECYQSKPENISVYIGPHIQTCHFEVQGDLALKFHKEDVTIRGNKLYINLAKIVSQQLQAEGLKVDNINVSPECTYCCDKYFSYRRDKPELVQTMLAYIGLK